CLKNTNVLAPGMYKIHTNHTQARTSKLSKDSKQTNKRVSFSTGVIPTTSVSRPQLKSNPQGDRVLRSNSRGKKLEVEEHRRNVMLPKNKPSVTACNDSLNAKTVNVKSVSAMCTKYLEVAFRKSTCFIRDLKGNDLLTAGSKDRPPMLAPGNYVKWKSRIKRYIDTKPNHELIHYCLENPPYELGWKDKEVTTSEGSSITRTERVNETYKNVSQEIRDQLNAEAKAKAIERLKQGESINVQDLETNLYWEFRKFTSQDGESLESYYSRFYKMMNELIRNQCKVTNHQVNVQFLLQLQPEWQRFVMLVKQSQELKTVLYHKLYDILKQHQHEFNEIRSKKIARIANPLALVTQQQPVYHPQNHPTHYTQNFSTRSQQAATRNRGKVIVNSLQPIYDQKPFMVAEDDETSKDKEIDKLMALISLSNAGYENQRIGNVAGARETVGSTVVQKSGIQCYNCKEFGHVARECQKPKRAKDEAYHREKMLLCKQEEAGIQLNAEQADWRDDTDDDELEDQELKAHYIYMAQLQEVSLNAADSGPIFDAEPLQKSEAELARRNSKEYASQMELECAKVRDKLSAHQVTISILSKQKEAQIKLYKTQEDKELEKVIELENKVKVLDNIVYKTGQTVQTMNMLNNKCRTSFVKPDFLKKAQRANPRLYEIGCYNDNLALMLAPDSDKVIRLEKESQSKLSDLIMPFDYDKLKNLYYFFVPQREKLSEQRYFSERLRLSHTNVNNGKSKESFHKQTTLLEKRMDESIRLNKQCQSSIEIFKVKTINTGLDQFKRCLNEEMVADLRYFNSLELEDLKAQLQDKGIVISELKKLIEKLKGKYVDAKFEKSSVIRQPNAFKNQRPSVLGKPTTFSNSFVRKDFSKSKSFTKNNVSNGFSKPVTTQTLPTNKKSILKNTNVLALGMYKIHTNHNQTSTSQLPQDSRKTNKRVSFSTGVISTTNVSRPILKSNPQGDRVLHNNSQGKKQAVEDQRRSVKLSKNKTSVTA
nr:hypothetical protein [Tanacetum cinerariifolium]